MDEDWESLETQTQLAAQDKGLVVRHTRACMHGCVRASVRETDRKWQRISR